jgi:hypothetical protein
MQAMTNLADEIRSNTADRQTFLAHLENDTKQFQLESRKHLRDIHTENQRDATILQERLASEEGQRQDTARQDTEQRRITASELRSHTHSLLKRAQLEQADMAKELKHTARMLHETISAQENARQQATQQTMRDIRTSVSEMCRSTQTMLGEVAADMQGARDAWAGIKKKGNDDNPTYDSPTYDNPTYDNPTYDNPTGDEA